MERFVQIFKEHPWWIVGGVLTVVVLIWLFSGSGKTETAVVNVGASDALIAATAAERVAQIQTNAATVQGQLENERAKIDNAAAIEIAGIQAGVIGSNNSTALGIVNSNNTAAIQINSQNVGGAVDLGKLEADVVKTGMLYQFQVDQHSIAADMQVQKSADWLSAQVSAIQATGGQMLQLQNPLTGNLQVIGIGRG
jgi:hypothetical protein